MISFVVEAIILGILGACTFFIPKHYFSNTLVQINPIEDETEEKNSKLMEFQNDLSNTKAQPTSNILKNLTTFLKHPQIMLNIFSYSMTFYGMGAMKFWSPDYMEKILKITNPNSRMLYFGILSLTGPTLGLVLGGLVGRWIGGYSVKKAVLVSLILDVLASVFGYSTTFAESSVPLYICLAWLYFFFSTSVIPLETGAIITSVSEQAKGDVLSFSNFILNLLGNLPPPYIYGLINDNKGQYYPKLAMECVFYVRFSSVITLILAVIFRYSNKINNQEVTKEEANSNGEQ